MVEGTPGRGKSYFIYALWKKLTDMGYKSLLVLGEEGFSPSSKIKMKDVGALSKKYKAETEMPSLEKIKAQDFVFFDSAQSLGLSMADIIRFRDNCTNTSFFFIYQTNKEGKFAGKQADLHEVDLEIVIPRPGIAKAKKSRTKSETDYEFEIFENL